MTRQRKRRVVRGTFSQRKNESPQESSPSILIWLANLIILNLDYLSDLGIECSSLAAAVQQAQRLGVTQGLRVLNVDLQ